MNRFSKRWNSRKQGNIPVKGAKRWRKVAIVAGVVLSVPILVGVVHHLQLRFALARYIAQLKAEGEPMDLAELIPPKTPPEQNAAPSIINAITNLSYRMIASTNPPPAMRIVAPGRAMIGWQQPDLRSEYGTNTWDQLGHELTGIKTNLDSLQILKDRPILDFNLDYKQGFFLTLNHLWQLRDVAEITCASVVDNLHRNDAPSASANVWALLALVRGMDAEPLEKSQEIRLTITSISANATWELLQATNVSEDNLRLVQQEWERLAFIKQTERAYLMERIVTIQSLDEMRKNPEKLWQEIMDSDAAKTWHESQWRWFWSYADEKRALQITRVLIGATRIAQTSKNYQPAKEFTETNFIRMGVSKPDPRGSFRIDVMGEEMRWIVSEGAGHSFAFLTRALVTETARNIVVTAIAIKRFQIRHQRLPKLLQELTPDFLTDVPIDWMDGQPLRYRLNTDETYLLYSVGENGKDDGGKPTPERPRPKYAEWRRDWQDPELLDTVWPQPATVEEVQRYYANVAKRKE